MKKQTKHTITKRPLPLAEFNKIFSKVPRATITLIIKTQSGVVLALRSLPSFYNTWHLPGSTIYYKEPIKNTIKRVAMEELGIKVKIIKLLDCINYPSAEKAYGFGWPVDIIFLCEYKGKKPFVRNQESSEIKTFTKIPRNIIKEQAKLLRKHWKEIIK